MPKRTAGSPAGGLKTKKRKTKHQGDPVLAELKAPSPRKRQQKKSAEEEQADAAAAEEDMIALADFSDSDDSDSEGEREESKRLARAREEKRAAKAARGVVYVGRLPYGFFERELRGYFSQFGELTRLRLSRNKKTGKSKHYAFLEFRDPDVAEIVAETMDGYLLYRHILQCSVVAPARVHPRLFRGANRRFVPAQQRAAARILRNAPKTADQVARTSRRLKAKEEAKRQQLKELGIDYEFPGYMGVAVEKTAKAKVAKSPKAKAASNAPKASPGAKKATPKKQRRKA